jgi:exonuclease III
MEKGVSSNSLKVLHQNIRGLRDKNDELTCSLNSFSIMPHILCLTEHFASTQNLSFISLDNYQLSSIFSRTAFCGGGACIYIRKDLIHKSINVTQFCVEKTFEICVSHVGTGNVGFTVLCIYRSPSGNFDLFLNLFESTLNYLHKPKSEFIICGDFNINFLTDSTRKMQITLLLQSFNLFHTVDFPTRVTNGASSAIDNIMIDITRINSFDVSSISNALSDHDA